MFKILPAIFATWNLCLAFICLITFINIQICIIALDSLFYFLLLGSSVQTPTVRRFKRFLRKTNFSSSSTVYLTVTTLAKKQICADIGGPIRRKSDEATRDRSNPRTPLDISKFCLTRSLAKLIDFRRNSLRDPEAQRNSSHAYTRRFQKPRNVVVTIANSRCCHLWRGEGGRRYALPRSTFRSCCCRALFVYERGRSWIMVTIDVVYTRAAFERSYRLRADLIPP